MIHVVLVAAAGGAQLLLRMSTAPPACKAKSFPWAARMLQCCGRFHAIRFSVPTRTAPCRTQVLPDILLIGWLVRASGRQSRVRSSPGNVKWERLPR